MFYRTPDLLLILSSSIMMYAWYIITITTVMKQLIARLANTVPSYLAHVRSKIPRRLTKIPRFVIIVVLIAVVSVAWVMKPKPAAPQYAIIEQIGTGVVQSGITAQGKINAAQKVDLNVYKQGIRLDTVNIVNGARIEAGDTLLAFEAGDTANSVRSAQLEYQDAVLQLQEARIKAGDVNYALQEQAVSLETVEGDVARHAAEQAAAKRAFYSNGLEAKAGSRREDIQVNRAKPTIAGTYTGEEGAYEIEVYGSRAESGYSYRLRGLETGNSSVYPGVEQLLGTRGLKITFPAVSSIEAGDTWVVAIPNRDADSYLAAQKTYDDTARALRERLDSNTIKKDKAAQSIAAAERADSQEFRRLALARAELQVSKTAEAVRRAQKTASERVIKAPFAGTVNGMRNVVSGTTLRTDDTTVQFGTLLSDDFLATFSLRIGDITRVRVDDTIMISIPSLPNEGELSATITEISVLPNESGSYEVRAELTVSTSTREQLREGLAVDIGIPQDRLESVIRVPKAALQYESGRPYVNVVPTIPDEIKANIKRFGSADVTKFNLVGEKRFITTGLVGRRFVEVTDGLKDGDFILTIIKITQGPPQPFGGGGGQPDGEFGGYEVYGTEDGGF